MLHPVGTHSPAVYWRRRLVLLASFALLVLLITLTARAVFADNGGTGPARTATPAGASSTPGPSATATTDAATPDAATTGTATTSAATPAAAKTASTSGTAAPPRACTATQLRVKAVVGQPRYAVGDEPVLVLQVTNSGPLPCVQDVADSQIELRVYNGASRVWGSHDCMITPGTDQRTLAVGQPAGFSITWTGLTSQPGCTGTRQRVGAGTYTLYASLAGHEGTAAQFAVS
jgi:hypothetical protein